SKCGPVGPYAGLGRPSRSVWRPDLTQDGAGGGSTTIVPNALGTLDALTYPVSTSGYRLKLKYEYTNGIATAIKDFNAPTTVIWSLTASDARGAVIDETLGANLRVVTGRDPLTGRMDDRQAGIGGGTGIQNL